MNLPSPAVPTAQAVARTPLFAFKKDRKINVAFFIFDEVEALDLSGPADILGKANHLNAVYNLYTVALTEATVVAEGQVLQLTPTYSIANAPQADVLILPGAMPQRMAALCAQHPELLAWIQQQHAATELTMAVCTGAFLLAAAGILDGKAATTHFAGLPTLRKNPAIRIVENQRYVQDGKVLTTAGITSGLDGTLHVVDLIQGQEMGDKLARLLVYNRHADLSFMQLEVTP